MQYGGVSHQKLSDIKNCSLKEKKKIICPEYCIWFSILWSEILIAFLYLIFQNMNLILVKGTNLELWNNSCVSLNRHSTGSSNLCLRKDVTQAAELWSSPHNSTMYLEYDFGTVMASFGVACWNCCVFPLLTEQEIAVWCLYCCCARVHFSLACCSHRQY